MCFMRGKANLHVYLPTPTDYINQQSQCFPSRTIPRVIPSTKQMNLLLLILSLWSSSIYAASVIENKYVSVALPAMRGSFAVHCEIPPGLFKRSEAASVPTHPQTVTVAAPQPSLMRGSFVFYGCCPGGHLGHAQLVGPVNAKEVKETLTPHSKSRFVKITQSGPMRGSFVMLGCPPGFNP